MTQKTIAGYDLDKVYEDEEARLKTVKVAEEAERRRQELEQKRAGRKSRPATTTTPATPPIVVPRGSSVVLYKNMEFEHPAYRKAGETGKTLLTYDASLARLRKAGFERHAHPQEVFGLLIDGLEGKLTVEEKLICDDQLASYGEWLSLAFERQGKRLITYLDPEGLEWKKGKYVKTTNFKCSDTKDFDITAKMSQRYLDLNKFPDDLVQFLYGRSFAALPQEMRKGSKKAQLVLPPDTTAWPVGFGVFNYCYDVIGYINWASRGVRERTSVPKK